MRLSFPHMGSVIVYKKILELLGHEVIVPPRPSKKTFDLGVKYSPEHACFPYKTLTGTYVELCQMGVETIVTSGGNGPCRAGFYPVIHQADLNEMGYNVELLVFDSFYLNKKKFMQLLLKLKEKNSWFKVISVIRFTFQMVEEMDKFDKKIHQIRPYEVRSGQTEKAWTEIKELFDKVKNKKELDNAVAEGNKIIDSVELYPVDESKRLRIGIVGEIYVVMEPSVNFDVEKLLGELGCETHRSQYLFDWLNYNFKVPSFMKGTKTKSHEEEILKKGEQFIEIPIGGHAKQSAGHIVDYKEKGYDGIIHLMPFGCLPELITQSVIPKITELYDIPVLSLSLDEQTGQANSKTRVEAFVDLIRNRKINNHTA